MFKKRNRMTRVEFMYFFDTTQRVHSPSFEIRYTPNPSLKVAAVVSKKVAKLSVTRNRIRRQLYHVLKEMLLHTTGAYIVIVKRGVVGNELSNDQKQELRDLVGRITKAR